MPLFIGSIFRGARGIKRKFELPDLIARFESENALPLLDRYTGLKRFHVARSLLDAYLLHALSVYPVEQHEQFKSYYLLRLKEEYSMARDHLAQENASRAETAALGLAVKELALSLDREVEGFRQSGSAEVLNFRHMSSKELAAVKSSTRQQLDELQQHLRAEHAAWLRSVVKDEVSVQQAHIVERTNQLVTSLNALNQETIVLAEAIEAQMTRWKILVFASIPLSLLGLVVALLALLRG